MWNVDEDKNKHIITSKEKKRFDEAIMQLTEYRKKIRLRDDYIKELHIEAAKERLMKKEYEQKLPNKDDIKNIKKGVEDINKLLKNFMKVMSKVFRLN